MKRKVLFIGVLLLVLVAVLVAGAKLRGRTEDAGKLQVTASFYPLAEFTRQIGGDKVAVTTLVAPGVEPHDYEPKPQDLTRLYHSALLVYNGAGFEHWVNSLKDGLRSHEVIMVDTSKDVSLIATQNDAESPTDPHVWLDPLRAEQQAHSIAAALITADPAHKKYYEARENALVAKFSELDVAYREGLATCRIRKLVTSHQAFGYIADRYQLTVQSLSGLSPDEEPSPQKLAEIAQFVKTEDIHYIFFESLVSPKLATTIANETGAQTLVFDPIEGVTQEAAASGTDYFSIQKDNLQNLRRALDCK